MRGVVVVLVLLVSGCIQINVGTPEPAPPAAATTAPAAMPEREPFTVDVTATPEVPTAGRPVTFQASVEGLDGRGFTDIYWDFGDGKSRHCVGDEVGACFRVTHTYAAAGEAELQLNVMLDDSATAQARESLIIVNPR